MPRARRRTRALAPSRRSTHALTIHDSRLTTYYGCIPARSLSYFAPFRPSWRGEGMNRFDRTLGLLLLLRGGRIWSATELAGRFGVSPRTIYRDVETLSALGVPVYAEMGRAGGFRLLQGYFLPPVMFTVGEAVSLLLGLTLPRGLRSKPFAAELGTAEQKLLAAVPEGLRATLAEARKVVGFEAAPGNAFHPEPPNPEPETGPGGSAAPGEDGVVGTFLRAVLDRRAVSLRYRSPY